MVHVFENGQDRTIKVINYQKHHFATKIDGLSL